MSRCPTTVCSLARVYEQWATGAMIAHWFPAPEPCAVFRTWLYIARFGPTDTSYHDMNQSPGMLIGMVSCQRPPLYHAGSLGARFIIAPPVGTGIESAKMPCGPSTALMMSMVGSFQNAFAQSTGGRRCARSYDFDARINSSCVVPRGNIGRTWFCSPISQSMKSICTAPPRYQFPIS